MSKGSTKFAGAYQRIDWAQDQIVDLKRQSLKFFSSQRYDRISQREDNGGYTVDKLRLGGPLPDSLTRLTVQIVENLRSALDHAACAIVVNPADKKNTSFPFGDTKRDCNATLRSKCKHLPDEIKSLLRSFKPYKRGNPPLWGLNKLCNTYKHRRIIETRRLVKSLTIADVPERVAVTLSRPVWNRRKDEIVISRAPGKGTIHNDVEFLVGIAFGKVPVFIGSPVIATLRYLTSEVNSIVVAIEAEARRIGAIR